MILQWIVSSCFDSGNTGITRRVGEKNQRTVPLCAMDAGTVASAGAGAAVHAAGSRDDGAGFGTGQGEDGGKVYLRNPY